MEKKLFVFFCILLFAGSRLRAQQVVEGQVVNAKNSPQESVSLILKDSTGKILSFVRTDAKGAFHIQTGEYRGQITLEFSSIGFKKKILENIQPGQKLRVVLKEEAIRLKDVIVKELPLKRFGDTLSYNTAGFADKQDQSIGDVLKKMPGITVDDAGKIEYNGKSISNFYIDGDNLLDNKYNIGTRAIPHDAVDKVQVIENDQPIKMLRKNNMSDDVALNLVLKDKARIKMMGDMKLGAGTPENYEADMNAMLFRKKTKFLNNLKLDKTGNDPGRDLTAHHFNDGLNRSENVKPGNFLSAGISGVPFLPQSRTLFNRAGLINLNNLFKINKDFQVKLNTAYFTDSRQVDYTRNTTIYLPSDTISYTESQHNQIKPEQVQAKVELLGNAENYYLKNSLAFNFRGNTLRSELTANDEKTAQYLKNRTDEFSNQFNFRKSLKRGNQINIASELSHTNAREQLDLKPGILEDVFNNGNPYKNLFQEVKLPTFFSNHSVAFTHNGAKLFQTYRATHVYQQQELHTTLSKTLNAGSPIPVEGNTDNQLDWRFVKWGLSAVYEYKAPKIQSTLSLPLSLNRYQYKDILNELDVFDQFISLDPALNIKLRTTIENYLSFNYAHQNNSGNIEDIYGGAVLRNYRSLVSNDAPLSKRNSDRISLAYNYKKSLKMIFFNVGLSFSKTGSNTISSYDFEDNQERRISIPLKNQMQIKSLFGSASKYLFDMATTIGAGGSYSMNQFEQLQNGSLLPFSASSFTLNANANTKFTPKISAEYDIRYQWNKSSSRAKTVATPFRQSQQQMKIYLNDFKGFYLNIDAQYMHTSQSGQESLDYIFADAGLRYRARKIRTDFTFTVRNIGNIKTFEAIQLSANSFTSGSYGIPGRMALLSARFNFH